MNFYPEYTGVIALDLAKAKNAPKSATATYVAAKNFEQTRGLTLLKPTPFSDTDTFTVLTTTATKDGLKTMSDLSKLKSFSYAGYPECQTRITCILGMKQIYGLKNIKFIPIGNISVYTLLDQGKATGGDGFSTDPQQLQTKSTRRWSTTSTSSASRTSRRCSRRVCSRGRTGRCSPVPPTRSRRSSPLPAMQAMNKAYVVDKTDAEGDRAPVPLGERALK